MLQQRILVVDDEPDICAILKYNLEKAGYEVSTAGSAEEALAMELPTFGLVLLDIMMGEMSGTEMAAKMKADPATAMIPIIFITAKDSEEDTVAGLNMGADDYISKPFSVREVLSRVAAVLRRYPSGTARQEEKSEIRYGDMVLDLARKTLVLAGEDIPTTRTEFEIMNLLLSSPGRVFSRSEILAHVWPEDVYVLDRTVDVNVTRLRKKLGEYGKQLVTRHGYGYCFQLQ